LERKKGDLELIEAKNTKILCKNIRHGRAWQWHGHTSKVGSTLPKSETSHGSCCQWHSRARWMDTLLLLLLRDLARPMLA